MSQWPYVHCTTLIDKWLFTHGYESPGHNVCMLQDLTRPYERLGNTGAKLDRERDHSQQESTQSYYLTDKLHKRIHILNNDWQCTPIPHPSSHSAFLLSPVSVFSSPSGLPLAEPSVLVLLWLGSIWDFSRSNASARSVRFLEQRIIQCSQKIKI